MNWIARLYQECGAACRPNGKAAWSYNPDSSEAPLPQKSTILEISKENSANTAVTMMAHSKLPITKVPHLHRVGPVQPEVEEHDHRDQGEAGGKATLPRRRGNRTSGFTGCGSGVIRWGQVEHLRQWRSGYSQSRSNQ
jgi:hypothetical protein